MGGCGRQACRQLSSNIMHAAHVLRSSLPPRVARCVCQELLSSESIASRSLQVSQVCEDALRDLCAVTAAGSTISTAAAATATALSLASSGKLVGRNRRWKVDRSIYLLGGRNQEQTHLRKVRHYLAHKLSWAPREEVRCSQRCRC